MHVRRKAWLGALLAAQLGSAAADDEFDAAIESYNEALALNPYDRRALEGLGRAYLEIDRPDDARGVLDRLADACRRLAHGAVDPLATCAEWQELDHAYQAYVARESGAGTK